VAKNRRARWHSLEFKAAAVEKMKDCENVVALSRELKVHWRLLYRWKAASEAVDARAQQNPAEQREAALREEIAKLKTALADKTLQVDFFRGALRNLETLGLQRARNGGEAFTTKSGS
jgi:transposase-like protein